MFKHAKTLKLVTMASALTCAVGSGPPHARNRTQGRPSSDVRAPKERCNCTSRRSPTFLCIVPTASSHPSTLRLKSAFLTKTKVGIWRNSQGGLCLLR